MSLIQSISGIRGTIGGHYKENLTPLDIVESTAAYAQFLCESFDTVKVVIGRDARISGDLVISLVIQTLRAMGVNVINCGLSTTPTIEMAVVDHHAQGGIILTASHNPREWNALKLLNEKGEFLSAESGQAILDFIDKKQFKFADVDHLGKLDTDSLAIHKHIEEIFKLDYVKLEAVKKKKYTVLVDNINSTGAISMVPLLEKMGCKVISINDEMTGDFAHTPEPIPANLSDTFEAVSSNEVDLGIVLDPDVDRIAFIDENANFLGEEYSLVMIADYVIKHKKGAAVSNLSSSIALQDVCKKNDVPYHSSAVGEVNVVKTMKANNAVIGGEGNGGIILPELHYGRDSLVGAALFLSFMATENLKASEIRAQYTDYTIIKDKISLDGVDIDGLLAHVESRFSDNKLDKLDGLKIYFGAGWVHMRKSNTEPIIRIYAEHKSEDEAQNLIGQVKKEVNNFLN